MSTRICPRCGRNDVRQSGRHSVGDMIMSCFGLAPYRCRACRNRFFRMPFGNGSKRRDTDPVVFPEVAVPPVRISPASAQRSSRPRAALEHPLALIPTAYSILIVSRDPAIRKLMCKLLSRPAYHTHQLGDVGRLPSELQTRKVDLLIVDLDEPEQERLEAVATLRSNYPNLRVIALSALSISSVPGSTVLTKPFRRDLLLASVEEALVEAADNRLPVS